MVLRGFTWFYWVWLGLNGFYRVALSFSAFFCRVRPRLLLRRVELERGDLWPARRLSPATKRPLASRRFAASRFIDAVPLNKTLPSSSRSLYLDFRCAHPHSGGFTAFRFVFFYPVRRNRFESFCSFWGTPDARRASPSCKRVLASSGLRFVPRLTIDPSEFLNQSKRDWLDHVLMRFRNFADSSRNPTDMDRKENGKSNWKRECDWTLPVLTRFHLVKHGKTHFTPMYHGNESVNATNTMKTP